MTQSHCNANATETTQPKKNARIWLPFGWLGKFKKETAPRFFLRFAVFLITIHTILLIHYLFKCCFGPSGLNKQGTRMYSSFDRRRRFHPSPLAAMGGLTLASGWNDGWVQTPGHWRWWEAYPNYYIIGWKIKKSILRILVRRSLHQFSRWEDSPSMPNSGLFVINANGSTLWNPDNHGSLMQGVANNSIFQEANLFGNNIWEVKWWTAQPHSCLRKSLVVPTFGGLYWPLHPIVISEI